MEPINILLIEDNEGDILLTTEALKDSKFSDNIQVVKDGSEALRYLEARDEYFSRLMPDLVLLDINLPRINGFEVLKKVKENNNLKHLPVIILSTSSSEEDVYKCYQNFASCFITKPLNADDFLNVISSIKNFWKSVVELPKPIS